jgi:hypothetical protein
MNPKFKTKYLLLYLILLNCVFAHSQELINTNEDLSKTTYKLVPYLRDFQGLEIYGIKSAGNRAAPIFIDCTYESGSKEFDGLIYHITSFKNSDELLNLLTTDAANLMNGIGGMAAFYTKFTPLNDKKQFVLVEIYPQNGTKGLKKFRNPVTFSPGGMTHLSQVIDKFGLPTSIQKFSTEGSRCIDLDGEVRWWGNIGIASSIEDKITHILIRCSVQPK